MKNRALTVVAILSLLVGCDATKQQPLEIATECSSVSAWTLAKLITSTHAAPGTLSLAIPLGNSCCEIWVACENDRPKI